MSLSRALHCKCRSHRFYLEPTSNNDDLFLLEPGSLILRINTNIRPVCLGGHLLTLLLFFHFTIVDNSGGAKHREIPHSALN